MPWGAQRRLLRLPDQLKGKQVMVYWTNAMTISASPLSVTSDKTNRALGTDSARDELNQPISSALRPRASCYPPWSSTSTERKGREERPHRSHLTTNRPCHLRTTDMLQGYSPYNGILATPNPKQLCFRLALPKRRETHRGTDLLGILRV